MLRHSKRLTGNIALLIFLFFNVRLVAQTHNVYLVKFTDKDTSVSAESTLSSKAIDRRIKYGISLDHYDLPVNAFYVQNLLNDSTLFLRYTLKWHNAAVISSESEDLSKVENLAFVESVKYVGKSPFRKFKEAPAFNSPVLKLKESTMTTIGLDAQDYGIAYAQNLQIGTIDLHKQGLNGKGVSIAIFDAGFKNIDQIPSFLKHQSNNLLTFGYDVAGLDNELNINDNHGTACASTFGAYDKGKYIGSAPNAYLTLFQTEFAASEYPVEELNWCKAAELADSAGIDLITSSLGYNQFDDKSLSYTHDDLDGKTSFVSLGATVAASRGIVVLNSAGNQGDNKWRKIGTPADVPTVITVGAVDVTGKPGKFSSQGYNANGSIKPDIAACGVLAAVASPSGGYYKGYGTSYSTPLAAGGVACIMQAFPEKNPSEIANLIRHTSSQSSNPDSIMGYGVAQFDIAYHYAKAQKNDQIEFDILKSNDKEISVYLKNDGDYSYSMYYTKKFMKLFKIKKGKKKGTFAATHSIARIPIDLTEENCSKKYTLKIISSSTVGNDSFITKDLSICSP